MLESRKSYEFWGNEAGEPDEPERRTWEELSPKEQAAYADAVDLLEGETMHDWWELYQDSLEER